MIDNKFHVSTEKKKDDSFELENATIDFKVDFD